MPYGKLKALTRGKQVTLEDLAVFIEGLDTSWEMKARLKALRPENYTGLAGLLAKRSLRRVDQSAVIIDSAWGCGTWGTPAMPDGIDASSDLA
jgi:hypothetical protein